LLHLATAIVSSHGGAMTSREATGLLPRAEFAAAVRRSASDWLALLAVGAVQWPWLLRSLYGGTLADKHGLLDRLGLPRDALPNLGSWKADTGLLKLIADHVLAERPKLVVEFGAGASTLVVARALQMAGGGTLLSYEQHPDFVDATRAWLAEHGLAADLRAVPLAPAPRGWPGLWYDHGAVPDGIELLIIDGPPWTIHPLTRGAAATLFDKIAPGGTIMLDDGARPGERLVARRWRRDWPEFDFRLVKNGTKGTLIGQRRA
jgi:predicted O-methyltransferase YrrM